MLAVLKGTMRGVGWGGVGRGVGVKTNLVQYIFKVP